MKYRKQTHDAPEPHKPKVIKPGRVGDDKIGVYDHGPDGALRLRGQVGPKMTSVGVSRFHKQLGSKLGTGPDGKLAWIAPKAAKPSANSRGPTLAQIAALGSASPGSKANTLAGRSSQGATAVQIKSSGG